MKQQNMTLSISHYLNNMGKLTNQWNEYNYKDPDRQRIYLKDIDCPEVWHDKLKEQIPSGVFYLNESTGEIGGPGSVDEFGGPGSRKGRGVARAGDLMSCLPPAMRADNMMCYIGHEGTFTPAHREMCASLGQNLMVETSGTVDEHGNPTKPGSSIWFMTETKDRHLVSEYWLSTLGHDIEVESHFAQINAWKAAPFKTYVAEQKAGDFILIPPLAPHQVWNRGTRTMKVAWNRTTVETLELALNEALPRARMVCRDEQYKNKAMIMFALEKYSNLLKQVESQKQNTVNPQEQLDLTYNPKIRQLQKDFKRLFSLYTQILLSEMLPPVTATEKRGQYLPYDSYITCSYCRCNIFNRFLTCTSCIVHFENGEEDTYDICMECYVMGRSCRCISRYKWVEQFPWQELTQKHELWRHQIIAFEGKVTEKSPVSLQVQRKNMTKKTLAQVCYEQLKVRPWSNPKKEQEAPQPEEDLLEEDDKVNDDGSLPRRRKKKPTEKMLRETARCHIAQHPEPRWKVAICKCGRGYHYGSLFRAFDLMPLTVMEDPDWQCPYCLKICSCGTCRKLPGMKAFEPNGTILGHDTRRVADPRSVESLVDFSHSNIGWIKKAGDNDPHETRRLRRRKDEAAQDKSTNPDLDDHYVNEKDFTPVDIEYPDNGIKYNMDVDFPIDPMLSGMDQPSIMTPTDASESQQSKERPQLVVQPVPFQTDANRGSFQATSGHEHVHAFAAPAAAMTNQEPSDGMYTAQDSNGITYQYPDPTLPHLTPSSQNDRYHQASSSNQQNGISQQNAQHKEQQDTAKRTRPDTHIIQSDLILSPKNDANEQYHHAQMQRALAEAKRNNRFISAQAALTGKQLRVVFRVDKDKLASLVNRTGKNHQPQSRSADNNESHNTIVQSDVPSALPANSPRFNGLAKKRKVRVDKDEDFSTRKKPDRKSVTNHTYLPSDERKKSFNYAEISSSSDDNTTVAESPTLVEKVRKPRKLPAYLAQRNNEIPSPTKDDSADSPDPVAAQPPVDSFPAKPLPEADASADLSMLGAGETTVQIDPTAKQVEENRKAKMRALLWAESEEDDLDSSLSTTPDRSVQQQPKTPNIKTPSGFRSSGSNNKLQVNSAKVSDKVPTNRGRPRQSRQQVS